MKDISDEMLNEWIEASASALSIPVDPSWQGSIRTNLRISLTLAASVAEFPLPDEIEPAPVFEA